MLVTTRKINLILSKFRSILKKRENSQIHKYYFLKGVSALLNILATFFCARVLIVEDFGEFNFIFSTIGLLTAITSLGLPQLAIRKISSLKLLNEHSLERQWIINSIYLQVIATLILPLLYVLPLLLKGLSYKIIVFVWLICFFNSLTVFFSEVFRGYNKLFKALFFFELLKNSLFLITLVYLVFFFQKVNINVLLSIYTVLSFLVILIPLFYYEGRNKFFSLSNFFSEKFEINRSELFLVLRESLPLLLIAILGYAQVNDNFVLGYFVANSNLSKLSLAFKLFSILIVFTNSTLLWFSPQIANACSQKQNNELRVISKEIILLQLIAGLFFYAGIQMGYPLIISFLGNQYVDIKLLISIYSVGFIISSLFASPSIFLTMANKEHYIILILPFYLLLYFTFSFFSYRAFGIVGISCVFSVCNVLYNLILSIIVKKELGFFPIISFRKKNDF